jgi:hypothetical protein
VQVQVQVQVQQALRCFAAPAAMALRTARHDRLSA